MPHYQHATVADGPDDRCHPCATLQLDAIHTGLFVKTDRISTRLGYAGLIGAEWHISNDKSISRRAAHGFGVADALIHSNGNSARISVDSHP